MQMHIKTKVVEATHFTVSSSVSHPPAVKRGDMIIRGHRYQRERVIRDKVQVCTCARERGGERKRLLSTFNIYFLCKHRLDTLIASDN